MKVLLINACHFHRGGSERVYFNTANLLTAHGHDVFFFSTSDPQNEPNEFERYFVPNGNFREFSLLKKIVRTPSYLFNTRACVNLGKLIDDLKPDVAHVHIFYAGLSVSVLRTLKKHKIPVVHTVHDYRLLCPVNTFIDKTDSICELCKDKHFYHCLKKRCSEGKFLQSAMVTLEAYFWKYFMSPLNYIDHNIFVSKFSQNKHFEFDEKYKKKNTQLYNFTNFVFQDDLVIKGEYYLYFGRLSSEKGIKTLLSVFSGNPRYQLKIAGTGPLKSVVEEVTGSNPNIEYVGYKSGSELEALIMKSSFVVLPSECYENNPLTIVEAYNFGKPVIGADIAGIPELIKHGENGFLFESKNPQSLESMIVKSSNISNDDYVGFSNSVKKFAQDNFSSKNHYFELLKVYLDVIDKEHIQ
jgi:glycosyltransferase involved in cell wall biosynthesis